jgi:hypothetical protein
VIDILAESATLLSGAGFGTQRIAVSDREALAFENPTVLGFLFGYDNAREALELWTRHADEAVRKYQFALRRAGQKAWNTYVVILCSTDADYRLSVALGAVEEDLAGTRKIARAGILDTADLRAALLPLLPLQSAPVLEPIDVLAEIRQRATDVAAPAVDAFLSTADDAVLIQILEEQL